MCGASHLTLLIFMKKRKIAQNSDKLKKQTFSRIHLKAYSSNLNHFQYVMMLTHCRRPQFEVREIVISKKFYLEKQVHFPFNSLILVTTKRGTRRLQGLILI